MRKEHDRLVKRLDFSTVTEVSPRVSRPRYDIAGLGVGIVHLGLGNFHRAHQAFYTDLALDEAGGNWGICGVSLQTPQTGAALGIQDGLYAVAVKEGGRDLDLRIVGAVRQTLFAPEEMPRVLGALADPRVQVVTLTITEKGYCHLPATGTLDPDHPGIRRDLLQPDQPVTALGVLAAGLRRRRRHGTPLTVVSCDNLLANGRTLRAVLLDFAARQDESLASWIADTVAFPCSMVDRIVPAPTPADRAEINERLGCEDQASVVCEPFTQWFVEDRFAAGRPAWDRVGVGFVSDVEPYERMKLRLLNGAHSALAYLGCLAGYPTIASAASDPLFIAVASGLIEESADTLVMPPGIAFEDYHRELLRRFRNPALPHTTRQVAMDGSQKLPPRLLAPIRDRLRRGKGLSCLALAVAAWMRFVMGRDDAGATLELSDPMAEELRRLAANGSNLANYAERIFGIEPIFGRELGRDQRFKEPVMAWLRRLASDGVRATLAASFRS